MCPFPRVRGSPNPAKRAHNARSHATAERAHTESRVVGAWAPSLWGTRAGQPKRGRALRNPLQRGVSRVHLGTAEHVDVDVLNDLLSVVTGVGEDAECAFLGLGISP